MHSNIESLFFELVGAEVSPSDIEPQQKFSPLPQGISSEGLVSWDQHKALVWMQPGQWELLTWAELSAVQQITTEGESFAVH